MTQKKVYRFLNNSCFVKEQVFGTNVPEWCDAFSAIALRIIWIYQFQTLAFIYRCNLAPPCRVKIDAE